MKQRRNRSVAIAAMVMAAGLPAAFGQQQLPGKGPPSMDNLPQVVAKPQGPLTPGRVDPQTGIVTEPGAIAKPVTIPSTGVHPHGTLADPAREAGRPMRPAEDPWIPDGTGYWPPMSEDANANWEPRAQPLMMNHEGPNWNGLNPPDPDLARGYDYQVAVTNDDFGVYDSCGNQVFYSDINDYLGLSGEFMFDPKVIFDPWNGRWVMMWHIKDDASQTSDLVFVVTNSSLPFGLASDVWYYRISMVQDQGTGNAAWLDYADLGYSNTTVYASGNMFFFSGGFRWGRIIVLDKSEMYAKLSTSYVRWSNLTNADGSQTNTPRSAKMQWSWSESGSNIDAYFVNSRWTGGNDITLWKLTGFETTNTLTRVDTAVGNYTLAPDANEPNGNALDTIDNRLMTAVITGDTLGSNGIELFTGMNADRSGNAGALLYKFNALSHALEFESLFGATDLDYWFPSSASDYSGSNFWVFCRTGFSAGNEVEIRFVDYDQGTFSSSSSQIKDGTGSNGGFRWGDYFGGQLDWGDYSANIGDPGRPAKVWLYGEYATPGDWGTHVGATSVYSQGSVSSVTPSDTWVITGPPGGPFSSTSRNYTLNSAAGDTGTGFEVTGLGTWLSTSEPYGLVYTSNTVNIALDADAYNLGLGTYIDNFVFDDCFNGNGSFTRTAELHVEAADLRVNSCLVGDGTYFPGDTMTVTGQYENIGNLASGNFTADFYASTNTIISPADTFLGSRNYASIAAGGTFNFGPHFLTTPCLNDQPYYIGVIITAASDYNSTNNTGYDATTIDFDFCPGDFNESCTVNTQDVIAFLNAWTAKHRSADCNGDGTVNTQDVICFLNAWTAPC